MNGKTRLTLLDRIRDTESGDSWREFLLVYDGLIEGWLRQQGVIDADAEDIRQEVLETVFREIGGFDHNGRPGAFRNWLRQVTANRMRRLWRRRASRSADYAGPNVELLAAQLEDERTPLATSWEDEHNRHVLQRLLGVLEERFSEKSVTAFRRIVLQEQPAAQVAAELGMTLGAARVAQHRVLKALKDFGKCVVD
ncbi:RNA polymerase sigma factor [Botrimarina hoheduenensis]|uniref:ECF RNA polymerase sigma factor SigE n=1 Tax=Botrimarina hoheduenensis TaxID=2528000 RepID=A0A5C5W965_9BACT|nr:sigma-70 family RNA polymerase sigma factor [Botrimarina hoheduenensis]TWT46735.1 ECF RNA polymerase sigma factor SigE [Botrimarina hoheduenensis]